MGNAYDTGTGSTVWVQQHAIARGVWAAWETNDKAKKQFDPNRMTDFVPRWESILGLSPLPTATMPQRRAALASRFSLLGRAPYQAGIIQTIRALLPNTYVGVVYTAANRASCSAYSPVTPASTGQPIGGYIIPSIGGNPGANIPGRWYSSAHHVSIAVSQPAWMADADFYAEVGRVHDGTLARLFPSWVTFGWFRDKTPPLVGAGPGFYLDDVGNLDNERLLDVEWNSLLVNGGAIQRPILPQVFSLNYGVIAGGTQRYANYYGLVVTGGPLHLTISLSPFTTSSCDGAFMFGTSSAGATPLLFHTTMTLTAIPNGAYVIEVNGGATDTFGVSPGIVTLSVTSP